MKRVSAEVYVSTLGLVKASCAVLGHYASLSLLPVSSASCNPHPTSPIWTLLGPFHLGLAGPIHLSLVWLIWALLGPFTWALSGPLGLVWPIHLGPLGPIGPILLVPVGPIGLYWAHLGRYPTKNDTHTFSILGCRIQTSINNRLRPYIPSFSNCFDNHPFNHPSDNYPFNHPSNQGPLKQIGSVDDFLLQTLEMEMRDSFSRALAGIWTLSTEETLAKGQTLTFLGIALELQANGDVFIHQQMFMENILAKKGAGNTTVQVDKIPTELDPPDPSQLKVLQGFSGEFNWLATRTRPDISYHVSVLASACTKQHTWSLEPTKKILRFIEATRKQGSVIKTKCDLNELTGWTDAGFAGHETESQSGLVVIWEGRTIVWRSSKQTVSTVSTAEAELNAAALGWRFIEGLRHLIVDLGINLPAVRLLVDNQAAITLAECGGTWRTRYFGVRGHRIHKECIIGRAQMLHCPTDVMLADCVTKLASPAVIEVLQEAIHGRLPPTHFQCTPQYSCPKETQVIISVVVLVSPAGLSVHLESTFSLPIAILRVPQVEGIVRVYSGGSSAHLTSSALRAFFCFILRQPPLDWQNVGQ